MPTIGGGIKVVYQLANQLKDLGHDVVIYSPIITFKNKSITSRAYVSLRNFFAGSKVNWFELKVPLIVKYILRPKDIRKANINIATFWSTSYFIKRIPDNSKKVYLIQSYELWGSKNPKEVDDSYRLNLFNITTSEYLYNLIKNKFGNNNLYRIRVGIDKKEFFPEFKKDYTKKNLSLLIMYSSNITKGYIYGIKACEEVMKDFKNIKLRIFGIKKPKKIPKKAEFILKPTREELRKIYSKSDIFVSPVLEGEGLYLPVLEAMSCKCAIIGTSVGALNEIGKNGKNCLISMPKDSNNIGDNIRALIENREKLKLISQEGFRSVNKLDLLNSSKDLINIFKNLI